MKGKASFEDDGCIDLSKLLIAWKRRTAIIGTWMFVMLRCILFCIQVYEIWAQWAVGWTWSKKRFVKNGLNMYFLETTGHTPHNVTKITSESKFGKNSWDNECREILSNFSSLKVSIHIFTLWVIFSFKKNWKVLDIIVIFFHVQLSSHVNLIEIESHFIMYIAYPLI